MWWSIYLSWWGIPATGVLEVALKVATNKQICVSKQGQGSRIRPYPKLRNLVVEGSHNPSKRPSEYPG